MQKNDIVTLEVTALSNEGSGIARHDGMVVFVPFSAVGDVAECRILKVQKSYAYAKIESMIIPSEHRIEPDCEAFGRCGGCLLRHIGYTEELRAKEQFVRDAMERIGGLDIQAEPIISTGVTERYRNKAQLPVAEIVGKPVCGFYSQRSHRVIPCDDCKLEPEVFSDISREILDYQQKNSISCYDEQSGKGLLRHIYLRRGHHSGEIMVCLVVTEKTRVYDALTDILKEKFPQIKTVILNINSERTNVILGKRNVNILGGGKICDTICGVEVEISAHSFYQVNTAAAELVYNKAAEYADLKGGETLLDLYCGAGTVGLSIAKGACRLVGVEVIPEAIDNAKKNALRNGIENAEFIIGDAGTIAQSLAERGERPDVITVDPPRKGCDQKTLDAIIAMSPERIVMISCNPATAARDVKYLCERGYRAEKVCPADMFPRTNHVECVVLMSRADK